MSTPPTADEVISVAAQLNALTARAQSNVQTIEPPTLIEYTSRNPWSNRVTGHSGWHEFVVLMKLDRMESHGPQYVLVEVLSERDAPPTGARSAPDSMGVAWFALPEYIATGQIKVRS